MVHRTIISNNCTSKKAKQPSIQPNYRSAQMVWENDVVQKKIFELKEPSVENLGNQHKKKIGKSSPGLKKWEREWVFSMKTKVREFFKLKKVLEGNEKLYL